MLLNRDRAVRVMNRLGLDALVATSAENVMYASDYECSTHWLNKGVQVYAALTPGAAPPAFLVAPSLELEAIVESPVWIEDVYLAGFFKRGPAPAETMDAVGRAGVAIIERAHAVETSVDGLVAGLTARGLDRGRIGLDESGMSAQIWAEIGRRLPNATFVPAASAWWEVRMVKTPEEIRRLRRASEITERAVEAGLAVAKPGASEADIVREYHLRLAAEGARPTFAMFGSGPRSSYPHILESDKVLAPAEVLRWDVGCTYRYYHSDTARAVALGKPDERHRKVWDAMVEGVEAAIALVRPGVHPRDIHAAAMKPGLAAGLAEFSRFHCGHGIGISVYDPPLMTAMDPSRSTFLMPGVDGGLEAGMVVNIEVGYYVQGVVGFLCEDTMLVTADGCERFTRASKALAFEDFVRG
ncbi:MAG: aminopeptidase P family protein [Candidatus Rokubacteria bacterium]|nr:aminopeptidase P family protein [Candidatus Rokubacteria bacterium]